MRIANVMKNNRFVRILKEAGICFIWFRVYPILYLRLHWNQFQNGLSPCVWYIVIPAGISKKYIALWFFAYSMHIRSSSTHWVPISIYCMGITSVGVKMFSFWRIQKYSPADAAFLSSSILNEPIFKTKG